MDNWFLLYLLTRLDAVNGLSFPLIFLPSLFTVGATVYAFFPVEKYSWTTKEDVALAETRRTTLLGWRNKFAVPLLVIGTLIAVFLPSKNDVFFIVGGSALIEAAQSDTAKRIGSKSLEAVEAWLDQNMPKKPAPQS